MIRLSRKVRGSPGVSAPWPWNFVRWLLAGQIYSLPCALPPGITTRARIILEEAGGAIFTVAGDELPLEQKSTVLGLNSASLKEDILCG